MKALVIGANGFLGSHLAKKLLNLNWEVIAVYNQNFDNIPSQCQMISTKKISQLKDDFEAIFLLAAYIPFQNMNKLDSKLISSNLKLVQKIEKKFKKSKIIFASSVAVYGEHKNKIDEKDCFINPNIYGLTKLIGENIVKQHSKYQILRFSSLYGSGMHDTFISKIVSDAIKYQKISLYGNPNRKQDYLHIDDAIGYCLAALENPLNGIHLAVKGESVTNLQVAKYVKRIFPNIKIDQIEPGHLYQSYIYNNLSTQVVLNFNPSVSLLDGIKSLIN